ncbi:MAG: T9SS type A sorting domain-containing protein [Bacteroidetes bacterium]|nr:T9SS type A sorting domain-containing protein [Bacteroidota bacterium]
MKTIRLLLLGNILLVAQNGFSQNLLPTETSYFIREVGVSLSPDFMPMAFYSDNLILDSIISGGACYTVQRTILKSVDFDNEIPRSVSYQIKIQDSTLYFTGFVHDGDDSIFFENELIFNFKLKTGDTLKIWSNLEGEVSFLVANKSHKSNSSSLTYELNNLNGSLSPSQENLHFDSDFGFIQTGLLPYSILNTKAVSQMDLISVCGDSLIYYNDQIFNKHQITNGFCDSMVLDSLFGVLITSTIESYGTFNQTRLFPNPSNGTFNFETNSDLEIISVFNAQGKQVSFFQDQNQLTIDAKIEGIYWVMLRNENAILTRKVVVR